MISGRRRRPAAGLVCGWRARQRMTCVTSEGTKGMRGGPQFVGGCTAAEEEGGTRGRHASQGWSLCMPVHRSPTMRRPWRSLAGTWCASREAARRARMRLDLLVERSRDQVGESGEWGYCDAYASRLACSRRELGPRYHSRGLGLVARRASGMLVAVADVRFPRLSGCDPASWSSTRMTPRRASQAVLFGDLVIVADAVMRIRVPHADAVDRVPPRRASAEGGAFRLGQLRTCNAMI